MKKITFPIFLCSITLFFTWLPIFAASRGISVVSKHGQSLYLYEDYHALVIGVSNYELWPKLPNAVKDAIEVADSLKEIGVHTKLVVDPTYRELKTALTDMVYVMGSEQNRGIIFFYAGHGETETLADGRKMGYIIPKDCPLLTKDPRGFGTHAISMREIESTSLRIKSKHVLMLFDSCFSGALFAMVRAVPHDISEKSTLPVRQYITAGREDEEVPDQSMFKRCLLIGLKGDADLTEDGYITGSELGMYLADKVVNYTHRQQHPQYGKINNPDLDQGDFVFVAKNLKTREPTVNPQQAGRTQEPKGSHDDLDVLLKKVREMEEANRIAQEALVKKTKQLREDLDKYSQIIDAKLDEKIEHAAWEVLRQKYPKWTSSVKTGDTAALVNNVLSNDWDGSLHTIIKPSAKANEAKHVSSIDKANSSQPKEIALDGRFVANNEGTVLDTETNLMWAASDSGTGIKEYEADAYCEHFRSGGYTDWRLPTTDEIYTIYRFNTLDCATKSITISSDWVYTKDFGRVKGFSFKTGIVSDKVQGDAGYGRGHVERDAYCGVLPVRSAK